MTLPKKGRRRVELDGRGYHWLIRKQPTYCQGALGSSMTMAIELADAAVNGTLLVEFGISRPDNWLAPHQTSVTPKVVREIIAAALAAGWQPETAGTFELRYPLILDRA
ncbi:MAG: hypothetical protein R6X02_29825 [Enhygromyxa sp.]